MTSIADIKRRKKPRSMYANKREMMTGRDALLREINRQRARRHRREQHDDTADSPWRPNRAGKMRWRDNRPSVARQRHAVNDRRRAGWRVAPAILAGRPRKSLFRAKRRLPPRPQTRVRRQSRSSDMASTWLAAVRRHRDRKTARVTRAPDNRRASTVFRGSGNLAK